MTDQQPQVTNKDILKAIFGKHKDNVLFALDILLNLVIIVSLVFLIRTFLISPFQVSGGSMCDTLNNIDGVCQKSYGEYIIVNKIGYQNLFGWQVGLPERGDIIVFHPPLNKEEFFIKRVIGVPGDTVKLKDGFVYVTNAENPAGVKLDEPYLNTKNSGHTCMHQGPVCDGGVFEVPANQYFVMGDNRTNSADARSCFNETFTSGGCGSPGNSQYLTMSNIEGKAWLVLWPLSKLTILPKTTYQL